MERLRAVAADLDAIDSCAVANDDLEDGVHLVVDTGRALMTFDEHQARTVLDNHQRARKHGSGGLRPISKHKLHRAVDPAASRYADHHAVAHECGVEID